MTERPDLIAIRDSVARVGRLSDGLMRFGPLRLGLDGMLTWIPGLGEIYSIAAGAFIVVQGYRAGVSLPLLTLCAGLMAGRTVISAIPVVGSALADLLTTHGWSARAIVKAIDAMLATSSPVPYAPPKSGFVPA